MSEQPKMSEQWITVATYNQQPLAALAKSVLDAAGIECWLRDEHVAGAYFGGGAAFGGIKLQVRPEDEAAAREALRQDAAIAGDESLSES